MSRWPMRIVTLEFAVDWQHRWGANAERWLRFLHGLKRVVNRATLEPIAKPTLVK